MERESLVPDEAKRKGDSGMEMSGFGDLKQHMYAQGRDMFEQGLAEQLAAAARESGMPTVDAIEVDLTFEGDPGNELGISEASIRRKANALLGDRGEK